MKGFFICVSFSVGCWVAVVSVVAAFSSAPPLWVPVRSTSQRVAGTATTTTPSTRTALLAMSPTNTEIEVISQPDPTFLSQKGVFDWGTWGCPVSTFSWQYDSAESCYLLEGRVTVTPSDGRHPVTFAKGDFVTFPAGMSCTWDVTEAVQKHYMFHS